MTDPLFFWRLHDEMTVNNAAILMVGGDPSSNTSKWDYTGFEAAYSALKMAITRGEIEAKIAYSLGPRLPLGKTVEFSIPDPGYKVIASKDLWHLLSDAGREAVGVYENYTPIQISHAPDWESTTLEVESLRRWLRSKGAADGFFVSASADTGEVSFADRDHEHFSAELALALAAWQALASEQRFSYGPKAAIAAWIDANPDAWLGEGDLSASAKDRIVTVVNWRKSGGAPSTGG